MDLFERRTRIRKRDRLRTALRYWAEGVMVLTIVSGWFLVLWAIVEFTNRWEVWPLGWGLFLLSIAGWGFLRELFVQGLYTLSQKNDAPPSQE